MPSLNPQELIKRLQKMHRLVRLACHERDQARAEAAQWKQRYERAYQNIQSANPTGKQNTSSSFCPPDSQAETHLQQIRALQAEVAQLRQDLTQEKQRHQQTRTSLITSLGDALLHK